MPPSSNLPEDVAKQSGFFFFLGAGHPKSQKKTNKIKYDFFLENKNKNQYCELLEKRTTKICFERLRLKGPFQWPKHPEGDYPWSLVVHLHRPVRKRESRYSGGRCEESARFYTFLC